MTERLEDLLDERLRAARARTPTSKLGREAWVIADDRLHVRWERAHGMGEDDFAASHRYVQARDALFGTPGAAQTTWSSTPHLIERVSSAVRARARWLAAVVLAPRYMRVDV